jgi:dTDP-4-amino-4,6-dideoxygalactose transaminase
MNFINNKTSKFGRGISLQWNGFNNSSLCISKPYIKKNYTKAIRYSSARAIIYQFLKAIKITSEDEIIVCAFTCDAVTDTVAFFTKKIIPVDINLDLTMSYLDVMSKITVKTKVLIIQNNFGRLGLSSEQIQTIKKLGIIIIEDCSLSYGSIENKLKHGSIGDISIFSLEATKSLTIGWGGLLFINNKKYKYKELLNPSKLPLILDLKRYIEFYIAIKLNKKKFYFGPIIWCALYFFKVLTKSSTNKFILNNFPGMGLIGCKLFENIDIKNAFLKINNNFNYLYKNLINNKNFTIPIVPKSYDFIVSPRFPILLSQNDRLKLLIKLEQSGLGTGVWFDKIPKFFEQDELYILDNTSIVTKKIINIPIHASIDENILDLYINVINNYYNEKNI